jgi:nitric oxide dioxygenase
MNTEQLTLIRSSLVQIRPIADQIARSFYEKLFDGRPHLRALFTGDMNRQGMMLMTSLELAVSNLDHTENIYPAIRALGERHVSYGVKAEYYPLAKEAYLWALEKHLGPQYTSHVNEAWSEALDALIEGMVNVDTK